LERQDILRDLTLALDRGRLRPADPSLLHLTLEDLPLNRHGRPTVGADGAAAVDGCDEIPQGMLFPVALSKTGEVRGRRLQCRCCRTISCAVHAMARSTIPHIQIPPFDCHDLGRPRGKVDDDADENGEPGEG